MTLHGIEFGSPLRGEDNPKGSETPITSNPSPNQRATAPKSPRLNEERQGYTLWKGFLQLF